MSQMMEREIERLKRHKALSSKSLAIVYEWAEENEDANPLAKAYMDACLVIGNLDCYEIYITLKKELPGKASKSGLNAEAYRPYNLSFIYRDTIGRMILDMLKRKAQGKEGK